MSKIKANPPVNLAEVSAPPRPGDELLTAYELESLSLFDHLKRKPQFQKFPGATFLRYGSPERVVFEQGDAGATAYYVLTSADVANLRQIQLTAMRDFQKATPNERNAKYPHLAELSKAELSELDQRYQAEADRFHAWAADGEETATEPVLSLHLLTKEEQQRRRQGLWRRLVGRRAVNSPAGSSRQRIIPVDAPTAVDADGRIGFLYEGDIFGEMSCMNRAPRSATVVVERECYFLEFLRNVFESVRNDPGQKQRLNEIYRQRSLGSALRQVSLFAEFDERQLQDLARNVELVTFEAGDIVFEEHDTSDAVYLIRSGLAKIVENVGTKFRSADEFDTGRWNSLRSEFLEEESGDHPLRLHVWNNLAEDAKQILLEANDGEDLPPQQRTSLIEALNRFICEGAVHTSLNKKTQLVAQMVPNREFEYAAESFPEKTDYWSELERRLFHRWLLETACPRGIPRRIDRKRPTRTLSYLGQGEVIGEIGLILNEPRTATCIAYDHPDGKHGMRVPDSRTGAVPSQLELVKIDRSNFEQLYRSSADLKRRVDNMIAERKARSLQSAERDRRAQWELQQTQEFEELGLVQGQKLMLIDLDRCTRCGECVEACIHAHDDGHTRLFLDGPRFGRYLVPLSCRKCLDPVCMIGCPVGAINRGNNGEIRISDWCIGCSLCANQCPYGSIQMEELEGDAEPTPQLLRLLESGVELKGVNKRAVVCDLCSSLNLGREACVYACPHDAAIRVNALDFTFED